MTVKRVKPAEVSAEIFVTDERKKALGSGPESRAAGGSYSNEFNLALINDTLRTFWTPNGEKNQEWVRRTRGLAIQGLHGIGPENELEGMIAAQMVAAHAAAIECYRRAAIVDQHFECRNANLNLASKASRTFAALNETLLRLRGKTGRQDIHVHQHHHRHSTDARTQVASEKVVVNVENRGEGITQNPKQPHEQKALTNAETETVGLDAVMRCQEPERKTVSRARDERQEEMQASRREKSRRAKG